MKKRILETKLAEGQAALFYLGQVGFLIKYDETYILIDGYLSDYVDQNFSTEEVVWKRKYPAPATNTTIVTTIRSHFFRIPRITDGIRKI